MHLWWCAPLQTRFCLNAPLRQIFSALLNRVVLGSDSPLTAAGDLLDEINFVHAQTGLDVTSLYSMVTTRPAEIFRLRRGEGALTAGATADLFVVRDTGLSPAATLAALTSQDIEMVMVKGRVQLAGASLMKRLPPSFAPGPGGVCREWSTALGTCAGGKAIGRSGSLFRTGATPGRKASELCLCCVMHYLCR